MTNLSYGRVMESAEFFERWARWRRRHDLLRETTDALQLTLLTIFVWIVVGRTVGLVFLGISLALVSVGVIGTVWKRRLERRHGPLR
jgi:hypothetical protein